MPLIYAIIFALVVLSFGWQLPAYVSNTLQLLSGVTIPLMLLALGVSLAQLRVTRLPRNLLSVRRSSRRWCPGRLLPSVVSSAPPTSRPACS